MGRWCMGRGGLISYIPLTCCESNRMLWASPAFRDPGRVGWVLGAWLIEVPGVPCRSSRGRVRWALHECPGVWLGQEGKYMSRFKVLVVSLLAVFAVSAAASATASAAHVYLIEQTELLSSEAVEDQGQNSKLETKLLGLPIFLQCQEELSTGVFKPKGESTFRVEFKNCYLVENSNGKKIFLVNCTVAEPIIAEGKDQLIEHSVDEFKGEFKGEKGLYTEITIEGAKCVLTSKQKVTGAQVCATPEAEFEKVLHHLICTPAGSKLVFGTGEKTEPAQFFGEEQIRLKSLKVWAAT
jgi:hypothetical protein